MHNVDALYQVCVRYLTRNIHIFCTTDVTWLEHHQEEQEEEHQQEQEDESSSRDAMLEQVLSAESSVAHSPLACIPTTLKQDIFSQLQKPTIQHFYHLTDSRLTSLDLHTDNYLITNTNIARFVSFVCYRFQMLGDLSVSWCWALKPLHLQNMFSSLVRLTKLNLYMSNTDDAVLSVVGQHLHHLVLLDISHCPVSDEGVTQLVPDIEHDRVGCHLLETLVMNMLDMVSAPVVALALQRLHNITRLEHECIGDAVVQMFDDCRGCGGIRNSSGALLSLSTLSVTPPKISYPNKLPEALCGLQNLTNFSYFHCGKDFSRILNAVKVHLGMSLTSLSLYDLENLDTTIQVIVNHCKQLNSVVLTTKRNPCSELDSRDYGIGVSVSDPLQVHPTLQTVEIRRAEQHQASPLWVAGLLASPQLHTVTLSRTSLITDRLLDIVTRYHEYYKTGVWLKWISFEQCNYFAGKSLLELIACQEHQLQRIHVYRCKLFTREQGERVQKHVATTERNILATFTYLQ